MQQNHSTKWIGIYNIVQELISYIQVFHFLLLDISYLVILAFDSGI